MSAKPKTPDPARQNWSWSTPRLAEPARVARWGHYGQPLLLFPTGGGDYEEAARFRLIDALMPQIDAGSVKVYCVDGIAGRAWLAGTGTAEWRSRVQNQYDEFINEEVVPLIRRDCSSASIEIGTAGASMGAFNAIATLCRHPEAFRFAIAMSGSYDLSKFLGGRFNQDFYFSSPLHYVPGLTDESEQLRRLRTRFALIASGEGDHEDICESWRLASVLGAKGIPNRVDPWGPRFHHDWNTWRIMLPKYLGEMLGAKAG
jgi:esterase/lipase superfamily enzyme